MSCASRSRWPCAGSRNASAAISATVTTRSGVRLETLEPGAGPRPTRKDAVRVTYEVHLADGTPIESTTEPAGLLVSGVISGLTEALRVIPRSYAMYRRLIARDGKPLDPEELARRDRKEAEKSEKKRLRREHESAEDQARRSCWAQGWRAGGCGPAAAGARPAARQCLRRGRLPGARAGELLWSLRYRRIPDQGWRADQFSVAE